MLLILHAFSARNLGDGLLVDLTLQRLLRLGVAQSDITLVALDPESFEGYPNVVGAPGDASRRVSMKVARAAAEQLHLIPRPRVLRASFARAQGAVAVGGGYLHTRTFVESMGCLVNHLGQMDLVLAAEVPAAYLPQSIGPLPGPVGRMVLNRLRRMKLVAVRDDESMADISAVTQAIRIPDLAVLEIGRRMPAMRLTRGQGPVVVVARDLRQGSHYESEFLRLMAMFPQAVTAVQADVAGAKSDRRFYQKHGFSADDDMSAVLRGFDGGVVVSVRLHGALLALLRGWPAIHLSYDRKGFGAFQDLGLHSYVHDARRFDADEVADQVMSIRRDPDTYWLHVHSSLEALRVQDMALDEALVRAVLTP